MESLVDVIIDVTETERTMTVGKNKVISISLMKAAMYALVYSVGKETD